MDKYEVINNTAALLAACKMNYEQIQIELVKMVTKIEGIKPLNEVDVERSGVCAFIQDCLHSNTEQCNSKCKKFELNAQTASELH